jgi:hypothetical protein
MSDDCPVTFIRDRGLLVSPNEIIVTGWIDIDLCLLGNRDRMAVGDLDQKWREVLARGKDAVWPPPNGEWLDGGRFAILDGRHEYLAALMHGATQILVAWREAKPNRRKR